MMVTVVMMMELDDDDDVSKWKRVAVLEFILMPFLNSFSKKVLLCSPPLSDEQIENLKIKVEFSVFEQNLKRLFLNFLILLFSVSIHFALY